MNKNPLLNHLFQTATNPQNTKPATMIFIHGLFGDMNNLGMISRAFAEEYNTLRIDLRNHGQSFHHDEMTLAQMADDLYQLVQHLQLDNLILIGHSLGGKTAMQFAHFYPELVQKLVVIDIAPVKYTQNRHDANFAGLFAVRDAKPENRQQAKNVFLEHIPNEGVVQFMLKSFDATAPESFKFNLSGLFKNYANAMDWQEVSVQTPTLFIKGANSDYMLPAYTAATVKQFTNAKVKVIANTDHWVHAEKPEAVIRSIAAFMNEK